MFKCIDKKREKNVITGYLLVDEKGQKVTIASNPLKELIKSGKIQVSNLTLTQDYRLVDHTEHVERETVAIKTANNTEPKLLTALNAVEDKNKQKYLARKTTSKRVGLAVKKCLLVGLASVSLSGTVTACGLDSNNYELSSQQESLSADDAIDLIENASELNVDTKNFKLAKTFVIISDGQEVVTAKGKTLKLFDNIVLTTNTDETVAEGEQDVHVLLDKYTISDKDGNEIYHMKKKFTLVFSEFKLYDKDDTYVAKIEQNGLMDKSAQICDADDNIVGEIEQGTFRRDFTIKFYDNCKLNKVGLTSACCNYIASLMSSENSGGHSSSSNGK